MAAQVMTFTKLMVRDLDAAERFYDQVLGLKSAGRVTVGQGELEQELCSLSPGEGKGVLVLSRYLGRDTPGAGSAWLGYIVDDVDGAAAAAEKAGGKLVKAPADEPAFGVRATIVTDPDGHVLDLSQPLAR